MRWKIWLISGIGVAITATLLVFLLAPQLVVLAKEGFPDAHWPAPGTFKTVSGRPFVEPDKAADVPQPAMLRLQEAAGLALLVDQGGQLARETYLGGHDRAARFNSYSLVKSLIGVLALRAVADGKIDGLDTPLRQVLGAEAPDISLREALIMTSGLVLYGEPPKEDLAKSLDDAQFSPLSPVARLHAFGVQDLFGKIEVDATLRGQFHYQSVNTALLGLAVEAAYGEPLDALLSRLIWSPAGAAEAYWRENPTSGRVSAYCCLYARPLDWLRVGRFLLNNGTADNPLLPEDLWREWILPDLPPKLRQSGAYGWQIRHDILDRTGETLSGPFAYMMGHGGQMVYLLPEADMVVVRFGTKPQLLHSTLYELTKEKAR
ncbi:Beta-lactamase [Pelagimonas phthalicica]|uniref:Beta-lactamase n=1 Tax=Pelagimonas phthalicica TaxID=1037362 RepID=A0A238JG68_9RHOB|nr:serine hydrolase [Pelagimonas phthalicica]TDS89134.1 CubicO group peptidase (beta-lactamase class C family) [Pelagimonas phthalicica]SMX29691.1 Beta-lactamase [Pelagimonas phthalicica]